MNEYIHRLKSWYSFRETREKILFIFLSWALIYAVFSLLILSPIESRQESLTNEIQAAKNQVESWKVQIQAVEKIGTSPIYIAWQEQEKNFNEKKEAYRTLLKSTADINWEEVMQKILFSDKTVSIVQIQNSPEEPFKVPGIKTSLQVYQQKLVLVIYSNFFDTIRYIKKLQNTLPTMHWLSLNYAVQKYPTAEVKLEFVVLYEKTI